MVDFLGEVADELHVLLATLLERYLEIVRWGGMPAATGLSARSWLHLVKRLPRWLVGQVEDVAHRLPAIPEVGGCFFAGQLTFEQLTDFVRTTACLNGPALARMDQEAATLAAAHLEQHLPPGQWISDVTAWVDDLRAPGWAQRQARRRDRDGSRVTVQQDFDGGGLLYADLQPEDFTPVVGALEARAGRPATGVSRSTQRAEALVGLCLEDLAGDTRPDGLRRSARPSMTVVVDLATATPDRFGMLLKVATGGHAPTLTARACEALAANARLRLQLVDGHNPLAEIEAEDIPTAVRRNVLVSHRECTDPDCHRPALPELVDLNHLHGRGGPQPHAPLGLVPACRTHHSRYHRHRWRGTKDPATGRVTFRHPSGTVIASLPAGARPPPWDRHLLRAPPIPAVPPHPPPDRAEDLDPAARRAPST